MNLNRRGMILAAASLLATAGQARGGVLRLKGHGGLASAPPPPASQTITLRPTDTQIVDLTTAFSGLPTSTPVSCTVTGSVVLNVWPFQSTVTGATSIWYVAELLNYLMASTASASTGSGVGTWAFTWAGGSYSISFNVSSAAPTTTTIGQRNPAQYGGWSIPQYLPTSSDWSDWVISAQSTPGRFVIVSSNKRVALAGTYGSQTRTAGTPTTGSTDTVTLTNSTLGLSHTLTFSYPTTEHNIAPGAGGGDQQGIYSFAGQFNYGDVVLWEDGSYETAGSAQVASTSARPTQAGGGPAAPAGPYAGDSWEPSLPHSFHPGFVQSRARNPFAATINKLWLDTRNYLNGGLYQRFSLFTLADGAVNLQCNSGGLSVQWAMWHHNKASSITQTNGHDRNFNLFVIDNYIQDSAGSTAGIDLQGQDCQIIGNKILRSLGDAIRMTVYDSVYGSGKAKCWWPVIVDKLNGGGGIHGDFLQMIFPNSSAAPVYYATPGPYSLPTFLGLMLVRGNGTFSGGESQQDGQGIVSGDIQTTYNHLVRAAGIIYSGTFTNGFAPKSTHSGSFLRQSSLMWPYGMASPAANGSNPPAVNLYGPGDGSAVEVSDCFIDAPGGANGGSTGINLYPVTGAGSTPPFASASVTNVVGGINGNAATAAASYFLNPTVTTFATIQDILNAYGPKPGGQLTVAGGRPRVTGAIGTGRIDHRLRTYDPTLLAA